MEHETNCTLHDILIIVWTTIKLTMCEIEQARWWCMDHHEDGTFNFDNIDYHVDLAVKIKSGPILLVEICPNNATCKSKWHKKLSTWHNQFDWKKIK